jgi:hypothetical protein
MLAKEGGGEMKVIRLGEGRIVIGLGKLGEKLQCLFFCPDDNANEIGRPMPEYGGLTQKQLEEKDAVVVVFDDPASIDVLLNAVMGLWQNARREAWDKQKEVSK